MDKALELLRELAGKLGQTVESLFSEVVTYNTTFALVVVFGWFTMVVLTWGLSFCWRKRDWSTGCDVPTRKFFAVIAAVIASILFFIVTLYHIPILLHPKGYVADLILR